jgi:hypothetical protein
VKIDPEDFRRHYASLSDEALLDIDANELTEIARRCYDEEISRRGFDEAEEDAEAGLDIEEDGDVEQYAMSDLDGGEKPGWLEHADVAFSLSVHPGVHNTPELEQARNVLKAAQIPYYVAIPENAESPVYELMVPSARYLEAVGLLDTEIFNPEIEANWRTHLAALSDAELRALKPKALTVGLLDRAQRLTRAYNEEMAGRKLRRDTAEDDGPAGARR